MRAFIFQCCSWLWNEFQLDSVRGFPHYPIHFSSTCNIKGKEVLLPECSPVGSPTPSCWWWWWWCKPGWAEAVKERGLRVYGQCNTIYVSLLLTSIPGLGAPVPFHKSKEYWTHYVQAQVILHRSICLGQPFSHIYSEHLKDRTCNGPSPILQLPFILLS